METALRGVGVMQTGGRRADARNGPHRGGQAMRERGDLLRRVWGRCGVVKPAYPLRGSIPPRVARGDDADRRATGGREDRPAPRRAGDEGEGTSCFALGDGAALPNRHIHSGAAAHPRLGSGDDAAWRATGGREERPTPRRAGDEGEGGPPASRLGTVRRCQTGISAQGRRPTPVSGAGGDAGRRATGEREERPAPRPAGDEGEGDNPARGM